VDLVPDEHLQAMFLGETVDQPFAMLMCPAGQIVRHADVKGAVPDAGHDIDEVNVFPRQPVSSFP
jgi:hypothetical protein